MSGEGRGVRKASHNVSQLRKFIALVLCEYERTREDSPGSRLLYKGNSFLSAPVASAGFLFFLFFSPTPLLILL